MRIYFSETEHMKEKDELMKKKLNTRSKIKKSYEFP